MDEGHPISKERRNTGSDVYGSVHEIAYRDYVPHSDLKICRHILCEYWNIVNRKDLTKTLDLTVKDQSISILSVDAKVLQLCEEGINIRLALFGEDVIGFMLYRVAFDVVLAIDGMFVLKAFRKNGIGEGLINSLEKPIKKLLFQTHLKNRPGEMFSSLEHMRLGIKKIHRDGDLITWESEWRNRDGNT